MKFALLEDVCIVLILFPKDFYSKNLVLIYFYRKNNFYCIVLFLPAKIMKFSLLKDVIGFTL